MCKLLLEGVISDLLDAGYEFYSYSNCYIDDNGNNASDITIDWSKIGYALDAIYNKRGIPKNTSVLIYDMLEDYIENEDLERIIQAHESGIRHHKREVQRKEMNLISAAA